MSVTPNTLFDVAGGTWERTLRWTDYNGPQIVNASRGTETSIQVDVVRAEGDACYEESERGDFLRVPVGVGISTDDGALREIFEGELTQEYYGDEDLPSPPPYVDLDFTFSELTGWLRAEDPIEAGLVELYFADLVPAPPTPFHEGTLRAWVQDGEEATLHPIADWLDNSR